MAWKPSSKKTGVIVDADKLLAEWLDRVWTLVWGTIVLSTGLLVTKYIDSGQWVGVVNLFGGGYLGLQVFQKLLEVAMTLKQKEKSNVA